MPRPAPRHDRPAPVEHLGGPLEALGPPPVRRRVAGDERLPPLGEVPETERHGVDAQHPGRLVHVQFHGPDLLGVAEPAEGRRRRGVRQHAARHDPDVGDPVRTGCGVAPFGHRPVGNVRVRADEVVRVDVAEHEGAVGEEPGPDLDLGRSPPDRLERLLEREHEADRPAGREGHERDQRLELRVLLAPERAAWIGGEHPDPGQWQVQQVRDQSLKPAGVLDRAPDRDPVAVGCGDERVRLDGELGHDRERVRPLDHHVSACRIDVPPPVAVLTQHVRVAHRVVRAELRLLDQRGVRGERARDRERSRQDLVLDADEADGGLCRILRLGGDGCDGLAVVLRLADREDRPVAELGSEPGHRMRQVGRRHHQAHAGHPERLADVDPVDPGAGTVEGHELHVERVLDMEIGDVGLAAGHPVEPAEAGRRGADAVRRDADAVRRDADAVRRAHTPRAHRSASSAAASTASMICW